MSERAIQQAIMNYLQVLENQGKLYFLRTQSGSIRTQEGRYFKTGKKGAPDLIVCFQGHFIGLEVKTPTGKQTNVQKAAQSVIEQSGGKYYIVRSIEEVIHIINLFTENNNDI